MLFCFSFFNYAEDVRSGPIDLYLIIDTSSSLSSHYAEALSWIRSSLLDSILQKDDMITIISAGTTTHILSDITFTGPESSQGLEKSLQSIRLQDAYANLAGAIKEARRRDLTKVHPKALGVALLITGTDNTTAVHEKNDKELEDLLRYSKVDDFPGWKLVVIGLNLDGKIKAATTEYQAFLNSLEQRN
ncbi:hypothetical protein Spica_1141 [Gracilinema caldarium DSM 7334]|uniref:VWFA domain-containing protein n=2 Tax=Gracilinema caldarium TaxID=215591 RepID=F8F0E3_GRAC1|nr:hypothetical protein Spica_1141 [Gracilinema caldarium DSM 7334]